MARGESWNNRLKAFALGLGIALTALTARHWYGTFFFGYPLCENCRSDFPTLYAGAKLIWQKPNALYDLGQQLSILKTIDPRIGDSVLPFAYPPTTALLLMPLGWTSFANAYLIMTLMNGLALLLALRLLIVNFHLNGEQTTWLGLTAFCSFGVHSAILQGQTSLMVLLLLVLLMRSSVSGDQTTGGLWSGALFFKPQFLPIPFLLLLAQRRWRGLAVGIFLVAGLSVISGLFIGINGIVDYVHLTLRFSATESDLGTNPADMHNLRALLYYALPVRTVMSAWIGLCALVAVGTLFVNMRSSNDEQGPAMQWVANLLAIILVSPHLHSHDLALLIPVNALVLTMAGEFVPIWALVGLIGLGIFPLLPLTFDQQLPPLLPLIFLITFIFCVRLKWKSLWNSRAPVTEF